MASETPASSGTPKPRRISSKPPAKSAPKDQPTDPQIPFEEFSETPSEPTNKNSRRRRGKSNSTPREEPSSTPEQSHPSRNKADSGKIAKNAWKIFLSEVSEEGVALISDNDARDLARRCFRLSELFLDEASRRA